MLRNILLPIINELAAYKFIKFSFEHAYDHYRDCTTEKGHIFKTKINCTTGKGREI